MNTPNTGNNSTFMSFSSNKYVNGTQEFLNSNSLVAKICFILLVFFLFVILLSLGINIISWFLSPSNSPKLINGMIDAKQLLIIPQDPTSSGAITVPRSNNAKDGIEFTWSVWIFIDDLTYNSGKYRCVFYKGNDTINTSTGLNFPNNSPGLYIGPNSNELVVFMNTFNVINEQITIPNIPINKWINVIIRCENTELDVYINGTVARSYKLHGVPKQNYGDVYVAMNGGFSGNISNLWYYNYALGAGAIQSIASKGPNTKMLSANGNTIKNTSYLSTRWYFGGSQDTYNP